jgi:phosphoglycerate kinase
MSLSNKLSITDVDLKGRRVLIRVDFNVSLDSKKRFTNSQRIVGAVPTINYAIENGAKRSSSCPTSAVQTARSTRSIV